MTRLAGREGFALPLTVFVVTLVTAMLAAVFVRAQIDRRIAESSGDAISALMAAQAGLERYYAFASSRPADGDSTRLTVYGADGNPVGWADVVAYVIRKPVDTLANWMYVVRSTGNVVEPTQGSDPQAVRTVAQFAQWQTGMFSPVAAFTAANRLRHRGSPTVDIRGNNDPCGAPGVLGARVPTGSQMSAAGITGWPTAYIEGQGGDSVVHLTHVDWEATLDGGFDPDFDTFQSGSGAYPTQMVVGDLTLTNAWGSGVLVVTGDLTLSGSWAYFTGILLVGGEIHFDASYNYVFGAALSGLNAVIQGENPGRGDIGENGKRVYIYYNSCAIRSALQNLTGLMPISNAWIDNWASY